MKASTKTPRTIDQYIAGFPAGVQALLKKVRETIRKAAPTATEKISYRIPAFFLDGKQLIFFAGFTKHIGMYPAPRGAEEFKEELAAYSGGKGTVQFPLDKPLPLSLIRRIVKYRAKQTLERVKRTSKAATKATGNRTNRAGKR